MNSAFKNSLLVGLLGTAMLFGALSGASALSLPYTYHNEQKIDRKQYGYTDVVVDVNGVATVTTKFSNGKQWDGDHFVARIIFRDGTGNSIAAVEQKKGLNGSFGGKAREGRVASEIKLTKEQWARVQSIEVEMGHYDEVDDAKVWEALGKLAEVVIQSGDKSYEEPSRSDPLPSPRVLHKSIAY